MGLLSRLFGKKPAFEERVWRTAELKLVDLLTRVAEDTSDDRTSCLVVYHFAATAEQLRRAFEERRVAIQELRRPGTEVLENLSSRVSPFAAGLVASDELPAEVQRGEGRRLDSHGGRPCHVHLAEHFPIPSRDEHVLNLGALLPKGSRFFCYVGLDEPWLAKFIGGRTVDLLDRLGAGDEVLQHPMLTNVLRRAQAKIGDERRNLEQPAHSSAEWLRLNLDD